jgi:O-antigen ligase
VNSGFIHTLLKAILLITLLLVCLFGCAPFPIFEKISGIFQDSDTQWMFFLCIWVYFAAFTFFKYRQGSSRFWCMVNPNLWLIGLLLIGSAAYAFNYSIACQSTDALILVGGATLGQGTAVLFKSKERENDISRRFQIILLFLIAILCVASFWHPDMGLIFQYRSQPRWVGPWGNPNIFGLIMAVGIVLSVGLAIQNWKYKSNVQWQIGQNNKKMLKLILLSMMLSVMGYGLVKSYSRGAWIGVIMGLYYLVHHVTSLPRFQTSHVGRWIYRNWLILITIMLAVCVLTFWTFRNAETPLIRRALSIGNVNDFSWRNRITAWDGMLQMMADHPCLGFGWSQQELVYAHYYRTIKIVEHVAIQMNDYLQIGVTLGLPALMCFFGFVWLRLTRPIHNTMPESFVSIEDESSVELLKASCRAGAIVLLGGFWFDGGLFELPTATLFWILLELGATWGRCFEQK